MHDTCLSRAIVYYVYQKERESLRERTCLCQPERGEGERESAHARARDRA